MGNERFGIANVPDFNNKKKYFETVVATDRIRKWTQVLKCSDSENVD